MSSSPPVSTVLRSERAPRQFRRGAREGGRTATPSRRPARSRGRGEQGVGIIEVMVAFLILLLVLVPVSYLLTNVLKESGNSRAKIAALSVAERWLETLNNSGPAYVDTVPVVGTPIVEGSTKTPDDATAKYTLDAGVKYYAVGRFTWASPGTANLCAAQKVPDVLNLSVTVKWGRDHTSITDTTLTDFPPAGLPKFGFIGAQIKRSPTDPTKLALPYGAVGTTHWGGGGGSTRVHTIPVTVTRTPATRTAYPTTTYLPTVTYPGINGCAFTEKPPGTYQVKIGPDEFLTTPFVKSGTTAYQTAYEVGTGTVTVSVDDVATATFLYDEGAYVDVSYPDTTAADGGMTCSTSAQLCIATGQAPSGTSPDGSTGTVPTVSVLSGSTWSSPLHALKTLNISRIESTACTTTLCVAVGYGPGTVGAAVYHDPTAAGTAWSAATPPAGVNNLIQIACPSTTACVAIGSGTTGAVIVSGALTSHSLSWSPNTLPGGVSSLSQITCPSATTCLAIGSGTSGAVILSGVSTAGTWTWTSDALPSGTTSLSQITCPSTTACLAIGSGSSGAEILSGAPTSGSWTWNSDSLPDGVSSLSQITCPGATACLAIGSGLSSAVVLSGALASGSWTWTSDTLPGGTSSLSRITCPAATACLAIGSGSSGAIVRAGTPKSGSWAWVSDTLPTGTSALSRITCPGTDVCLAVGEGSSGAAVLVGAASGTAETWASETYPSGVDPTFFSGVGCYKASSGLTCAAPGGAETGAVLLSHTDTGNSASTWSTHAPTTGSGVVAGGLAISVSSTALTSSFFVACGASTTDSCADIGPLFPYTVGYSIGAGSCNTELITASVHAKSTPAATATRATKVKVPLGLLNIKVVNASDQAVAGATVTAKAGGGPNCDGDILTLGTTGETGQVGAAIMYQTYVVTVTAPSHTLTKTITVSATSVTATATTYSLPSSVVFVT